MDDRSGLMFRQFHLRIVRCLMHSFFIVHFSIMIKASSAAPQQAPSLASETRFSGLCHSALNLTCEFSIILARYAAPVCEAFTRSRSRVYPPMNEHAETCLVIPLQPFLFRDRKRCNRRTHNFLFFCVRKSNDFLGFLFLVKNHYSKYFYVLCLQGEDVNFLGN